MALPDYTDRNRETYDSEQVILTAGTITANVAAGAGVSTPVNLGTNVSFEAKLQVRGAVTASKTLDVSVHESATEGGTYTLVEGCSFTQQTVTGADLTIQGRTTHPWVAAKVVVSGGSESFADTECFIVN